MRPLITAEIVAVGSELLTPSRTDTNSLYITGRLAAIGVEVRAKHIVGDSRRDLEAVVRESLERADLLVLTGGLGPTDDDVTRDVVSSVLGRPMREDPAIVEKLRSRFAARGLQMPEINRRQAMVPEGADVLPNANGTAPGLWLADGDRVVVLLPGPPREMRPMIDALVADRLRERSGTSRRFTRIVRLTGRTESHTEEAARPYYEAWAAAGLEIDTTILAAFGSIELHLTLRSETEAEADRVLSRAVSDLERALAPNVYSVDGRALEEVVGGLLAERGWRIAVAESCTGGLMMSRLTDVPGSSAYVERGVVSYSNEAKVELLDVSPELLREHGAVSEPVARAMAEGIRARARVQVAVGITGIAGPTGGTDAKPVGTVAIAVITPVASEVRSRRFPGDRDQVKFQATQAALDAVRRLLQQG
jgi:nicotinamide-nucleotide amidase